jgi:hypothetical protein
VNPIDERSIRERLHDELGSMEISPVPVIAVTRRGKAIRARRRAAAGGFAAVAVVAVLAVRAAQGPAPAEVTVNAPTPGAPGGVFASGTANGKPWRMTVRNIAADPGTRWCLPAATFNGRDGDVLFKTLPGAQSFGSPALLRDPSGFHGFGAMFTQVAPDVTRVVVKFPGGWQETVRPVWVSACTQRFHLAGLVLPGPGRGGEIDTYIGQGFDEGLSFVNGGSGTSLFGRPSAPGVWANLDTSRADIAASQAASPIGHGTVAGQIWHIRTMLGLFGQCYTAALRGPARGTSDGRGQSSECVPVAMPPRAIALTWVSVPGATAQFSGYAGLVNPRTARVVVSFSGAPNITVRPVTVAGRAYVAFVVPPGCDVARLIVQFARHAITITSLPPAN